MKLFRSRTFIVFLSIALVLVIVPSALSLFGLSDWLRGGLKTLAVPFEWIGSRAADAVSGFVAVFTEHDELTNENQALKDELAEVEDNEKELEALKEENRWLKQFLSMKSKHPDFVLCEATVISRESGNYATVLTLNRGSAHGVKKKMPVITPDGVLGHVSEVGLDWCKVVSIVETASTVSAYSERAHVSGVVEGDNLLREDGLCRMTYIEADADIRPGDRILTGGNGAIYPPDLILGTVVSVEADEYSRTLVAYIEPAVDFSTLSDLQRAVVILGYAKGDETT